MAAMLAGALALSLVVRVYDAYGVSNENIIAARVAVERIMKDARVAVTWTMCPCETPVSTGELVLRIVAAAPSSAPDALGFSYVDVEQHKGTLATVFADRIRALAAGARVDAGELLGRAIAHELSHLLLGTHDHEPQGLMRGYWAATDLSTQSVRDWTLSADDGVRIRQAVARRLLEATPPVVLTADADAMPDVSAQ
jgi:hypothetical protein